ncbi:carbohydrate ABC transporter permease [Bacillus sp. FJAT-26390]|uniref:carbohydrate ABC transporter permease n=1 Tax=Bacillus sp. FJAT-26390 TaxID=1743142 RepID=UPI000807CB2B|nr:carbohydrate ABC transporter permease [Bacillus sp. FJAT-26390]OBZ12692.1 sugar ABC transporter permease [Bacillus sp. FJAT-26390]
MMRKSVGDVSFSVVNYTFLAVLGLVTLYPFLNLLAISFNDSLDSLRGAVYVFPNQFTLDNYRVVFRTDTLLNATVLSVTRTLLGTFLSVLCTAMLAYTLSRREYIYRKTINSILIVSMYVNGGIIPTYLLIKNLDMTNTFWVYIIPGLISVFNVIIMRSYFEQLPEGLIESAKVEGASDIKILMQVILPISMPVLSTITLFVAVGHWSSWFDNYLYNSKESLSVLQYELMKILIQSTNQVSGNATGYVDKNVLAQTTPQSIRATLTVLVTMPIILIYPFLQKYFIKGMMIGAMKE